MRWPKQLSRCDPNAHKNDFGHVLILAGSPVMLGAAALAALAAMRTGAGLVTCGIPTSLNLALQKKISPVIMTLPLPQTKTATFALPAYKELQRHFHKFNAIVIGPGMGQSSQTQKFILTLIARCRTPLVIDADALNALAKDPRVLLKNKGVRILTPHPGEMARLTGCSRQTVEHNRSKIAAQFAKMHECIVVLKGHRTVIASPQGKVYINRTGNAGMATAGSGDVLTGVIAALLGQGIGPLESARLGAYLHGKAGDAAASSLAKAGMIAVDIIDHLPLVMKKYV